MARINFIVQALSRDRFSGGILCIFEYASGLVARGHEVAIVPIAPSQHPSWFNKPFGKLVDDTPRKRLLKAIGEGWDALLSMVCHGQQGSKASIRNFTSTAAQMSMSLFAYPIRLALFEGYAASRAPVADINIATGFETARPTALLPGRNFYFCQHYEPYFCNELPDSEYARFVAEQSYRIGLQLIVNSSWLENKLKLAAPDASISVCPNAIDHSTFYGTERRPRLAQEISVISYGGRDAVWKGFYEMAEAMSIARKALPDWKIDWKVFGECLLPPNNDIAPYTYLGFLPPSLLRTEYQNADILLSASWYESFPLFPLEAMACGCAVLTTASGTEEYAAHGVTAEVVPAKSPNEIAQGLIRLIKNPEYRKRLSLAGQEASKRFEWQRSVARLEAILGVSGVAQ